jgi:hypothetical protein
VSRNHPPKIWNFYLKPDEIARLMNDREALRAKIHETLAVIDLESLSHFGQSLSLAGIPPRVE